MINPKLNQWLKKYSSTCTSLCFSYQCLNVKAAKHVQMCLLLCPSHFCPCLMLRVHVCVCVCERARERESVRVCVCVRLDGHGRQLVLHCSSSLAVINRHLSFPMVPFSWSEIELTLEGTGRPGSCRTTSY